MLGIVLSQHVRGGGGGEGGGVEYGHQSANCESNWNFGGTKLVN